MWTGGVNYSTRLAPQSTCAHTHVLCLGAPDRASVTTEWWSALIELLSFCAPARVCFVGVACALCGALCVALWLAGALQIVEGNAVRDSILSSMALRN